MTDTQKQAEKETETLLRSGIPGISEYLELDRNRDYQQLLSSSRQFRKEVETREVFSRLYSIKWVKDPFLQWSRRWEYVYVLQRLRSWWQNHPQALDVADGGSGFTFFPFYLRQLNPLARINCVDADATVGRAIEAAARVLSSRLRTWKTWTGQASLWMPYSVFLSLSTRKTQSGLSKKSTGLSGQVDCSCAHSTSRLSRVARCT